MTALPEITRQHLDKIQAFYDAAPVASPWASRGYRRLLAHHYNLQIPAEASVLEIGCGAGELLGQLKAARRVGVDLSPKQIEAARVQVPGAEFHVQAGESLELDDQFDYIIISDTLNLSADVQALLSRLHRCTHRDTKLLLNFQNSLWRPLLSLAGLLGLRGPQPQSSWLASSDVINLLSLGGWTPVCTQNHLLFPVPIPGLNFVFNRCLAPLFQWFCLTIFMVARPARAAASTRPPTVSVIIPARNEAGNIEAAVRRTPNMGGGTELVFVEGHSRDHTWAEIQRVAKAFPDHKITILQQTGKGKGDAVRLGFAAATGDILMILDADLTMPPEELPKFYDVIASGQAEFANGGSLVYLMDEKAGFSTLRKRTRPSASSSPAARPACSATPCGTGRAAPCPLRPHRRQPRLLRRLRSVRRLRPARRRPPQSQDRRRPYPLQGTNLRHHEHPTLEPRPVVAPHGRLRFELVLRGSAPLIRTSD
ncbi:MAG: bifunctional class I SAM-dependent methyltransferase/glycosyltransferase family 2 protein [Opitutaceae bacterium]